MKAKVRTRNWFIEINPNAKSYQLIDSIIKELNVVHYAYIYHSAEKETNENDRHIHLCIELKNPSTFTTMINHFVGAHVEPMKHKNVSYQYLIHKNDCDKIQYSIDNVICDSIDYYKIMLDNDEYIYLDTNSIIEEISKGNNTILGLIKTYGINQVQHKLGVIKSLIAECENNSHVQLLEYNYQDALQENQKLKSLLKEKEEKICKLEKELGYLPF